MSIHGVLSLEVSLLYSMPVSSVFDMRKDLVRILFLFNHNLDLVLVCRTSGVNTQTSDSIRPGK